MCIQKLYPRPNRWEISNMLQEIKIINKNEIPDETDYNHIDVVEPITNVLKDNN